MPGQPDDGSTRLVIPFPSAALQRHTEHTKSFHFFARNGPAIRVATAPHVVQPVIERCSEQVLPEKRTGSSRVGGIPQRRNSDGSTKAHSSENMAHQMERDTETVYNDSRVDSRLLEPQFSLVPLA